MLRTFFINLRLGRKVLLISAVTVVLSAAMLGVAVHGARTNTRLLQTLDQDVFEPLHAAHRLQEGITQLHASLAALLMKSVIEADNSGWTRATASVRRMLLEQTAAAAGFRVNLRVRLPEALIVRLYRAYGAYVEDAMATVNMASVDAGFGESSCCRRTSISSICGTLLPNSWTNYRGAAWRSRRRPCTPARPTSACWSVW